MKITFDHADLAPIVKQIISEILTQQGAEARSLEPRSARESDTPGKTCSHFCEEGGLICERHVVEISGLALTVRRPVSRNAVTDPLMSHFPE